MNIENRWPLLVQNNGVIFTNGGGATYLPGNAAGSASAGGRYV